MKEVYKKNWVYHNIHISLPYTLLLGYASLLSLEIFQSSPPLSYPRSSVTVGKGLLSCFNTDLTNNFDERKNRTWDLVFHLDTWVGFELTISSEPADAFHVGHVQSALSGLAAGSWLVWHCVLTKDDKISYCYSKSVHFTANGRRQESVRQTPFENDEIFSWIQDFEGKFNHTLIQVALSQPAG